MKIKLNYRLLISILSVTVIVFMITFFYIGYKIKPILRNDVERIADAYAGQYANLVRSFLTEEMHISKTMAYQFETMGDLSGEQKIASSLKLQEKIFSEHLDYRSVWMSWELQFLDPNWQKPFGRIRINLHGKGGKNTVQFDTLNANGDDLGSLYLETKTKLLDVLTDPYVDNYDGVEELVASVCNPVIINGQFAGLAGIDIPLSRFKDIISKAENIYESNVFLVANDGIFVGNQDKKFVGTSIKDVFAGQEVDILAEIKKGKPFSFNFSSEEKGDFYCTFHPFNISEEGKSWMVGVAIPNSAIIAESTAAYRNTLIVGILGLFLLSVVIYFISNSITKPLTQITKSLQLLAKGEINKVHELSYKSKDEIGDIASSTNTLIEGLSNTAHFAKEIGQGNMSAEYESISDQDVLGNALIGMRESLLKAKNEEELRREKEEEQKWATVGHAKFGELLRNNTDNMETFTNNVVSNLVKYTESNQGAMFLLDQEDEHDQYLTMSACYAYDRKKYVNKRVEIGENLVGQCYLEGEKILMTDVPENYVHITSGLGDANPRSLLLVPLKFNDNVYGVIELASFNKYQDFQIDFIEKVAESIASTISSVRVNIRTIKLLEESKLKSEELAAQEEEMRQNMEELQTTQEESARRELEMNGILNALNSSYLVAELDLDGNILTINDNALELLGLAKNDAEGHNMRSFLKPDELEEFENLWNNVLNGRPMKRQSIIERSKGKIVLTESYTPIFDDMDELYKILNIGIEVNPISV